MTTKEQERKALEQIRKIVEGLGENSYVGTALEGCFEIAEENIENDFACSMMDRKEAAEFAEDQLRKKVADLEKSLHNMETSKHIAEIERDEKERTLDSARQAMNEWKAAYDKAQATADESEAKLKAAENEIIHLKAKLYDLMVK